MIENEGLKGFLMTTLFMLKVKLLKVKVEVIFNFSSGYFLMVELFLRLVLIFEGCF